MSNDDGKEVEIAQLNDGDYCGEHALLKGAGGASQRGPFVTRNVQVDAECLFQKAGEHGLGLLHWDRRPCAQRSARRSGHVSEDYLDTAKHIAKQCGTCLLRTKRSYDFCAVMPGLNSSPNPS